MDSKMPPPLAVLPPILLGLPPSPPLQLLPPLNLSLGLPPPSGSTTGISLLGAPSLQLPAVIRRKAKWLKCLTLSGKKEGACRIICIKGGKKLIEFCLLIQGLTFVRSVELSPIQAVEGWLTCPGLWQTWSCANLKKYLLTTYYVLVGAGSPDSDAKYSSSGI